ncbi:hypothetical protein [Salinarimonas sp.]|uniref:hypothetical protein n=1 Tax=Salinarimonas sp. TaxID=2766526 RepID=UPI003919365A
MRDHVYGPQASRRSGLERQRDERRRDEDGFYETHGGSGPRLVGRLVQALARVVRSRSADTHSTGGPS